MKMIHDRRQLSLFAVHDDRAGVQKHSNLPTLAESRHMLHVCQAMQLNTSRPTADRARLARLEIWLRDSIRMARVRLDRGAAP
jgi:hypothetical protein